MKLMKTFFAAAALTAATFAALPAHAQDPGPAAYAEALKGKRILLVPMAMGFDLAQGWAAIMKREVGAFGGVFETRDPNWSVEAGAQAITEAISSDPKPDVLIVMSDHGIRTAMEHSRSSLFVASGPRVPQGRAPGWPALRGVSRALADLLGVATSWPDTGVLPAARAIASAPASEPSAPPASRAGD